MGTRGGRRRRLGWLGLVGWLPLVACGDAGVEPRPAGDAPVFAAASAPEASAALGKQAGDGPFAGVASVGSVGGRTFTLIAPTRLTPVPRSSSGDRDAGELGDACSQNARDAACAVDDDATLHEVEEAEDAGDSEADTDGLLADIAADLTDAGDMPASVVCEHYGEGLVGAATDPGAPSFVDISYLAESGSLHGLDTGWGGVAIIDVDLDGAPDLVYTADLGHVDLLRNCGDGTFTPMAGAFPEGVRRARAIAVGDVDNDGDPDLWVGSWARTYLYLNQGDGTFVDATLDWHLGYVAGAGGASFVDFDGDGDLDLYEAFYETGRNRLRRNDGDHFTELTTTPGNAPLTGNSLVATWTDLDGDGRPDLHLVNDFGPFGAPNRLFVNRGPDPTDANGWRFEDAGVATGFQVAVFGMGSAYGDIDNDGDLDAYTANVGRNVMHVQGVPGVGRCPANSFGFCVVDRAVALGVAVGQVSGAPASWPALDSDSTDPREAALATFIESYCDVAGGAALVSFGVNFFDADQNGWIDLFVSNGWVHLEDVPTAYWEANELFLNTSGAFTRVATDYLPTTLGTSRGSAVGDLDGDGDLDLVWLDSGRVGAGRLVVMENRAATGHWLRVQLIGSSASRDALGARVTVVAGGLSQIREVSSGQGFASENERHPHFGLGAATMVDELRVHWPSGTDQILTNVAADQWVVLEEPGGD